MKLLLSAGICTLIMCLLTIAFILFSGYLKVSLGGVIFYCSLVVVTAFPYSLIFGAMAHNILKKRGWETITGYIVSGLLAGLVVVFLVAVLPALLDDVPFGIFHRWLSVALLAASMTSAVIFYAILKPKLTTNIHVNSD